MEITTSALIELRGHRSEIVSGFLCSASCSRIGIRCCSGFCSLRRCYLRLPLSCLGIGGVLVDRTKTDEGGVGEPVVHHAVPHLRGLELHCSGDGPELAVS